jgi:hypothetical protein
MPKLFVRSGEWVPGLLGVLAFLSTFCEFALDAYKVPACDPLFDVSTISTNMAVDTYG